jgi:hypothetical protein
MGFIVGYYRQSMCNGRGRDQDVGIADQLTSSVKIGIYRGCLHNYGIGDRQHSASGTQQIECGKLFCRPFGEQTTQHFIACND